MDRPHQFIQKCARVMEVKQKEMAMNNEELLDFLQLVRPSTTEEKSKPQKNLMWCIEENTNLVKLLDNQQDEIDKLTMEKHNDAT